MLISENGNTSIDLKNGTLEAKNVTIKNSGGTKMEDKIKELELKIKDLEGKISTLTQASGNLQSQINTKVDKNEVISAINISEEGIQIKGNKIHVDRTTLIEHGTFNN
ncbi:MULTISPECIES: hypothetical protein [unclassified Oceanobacillus]|uniref:hypothetical protein n=1 Tax=unclassified Oceanobacillus TaxID=2630292 RepID=UPI00300E3F42